MTKPLPTPEDRKEFFQDSLNGDYNGVLRHLEKFGDTEANATVNGQTVLMYAVAEGQAKIVSLLLERGADVQTLDKWNRSARVWAVECGHHEVVRILDQWIHTNLSRKAQKIKNDQQLKKIRDIGSTKVTLKRRHSPGS